MITLRLPSNQKPYDDYFSGDPAFVQGDDVAHAAKIQRARETGDWSALLIPGSTATKFVLRPITGEQVRHLVDRIAADKIGGAALAALAFRCAIQQIVTEPDLPVTFVSDPYLGRIASVDITNTLDAIDFRIVAELGGVAFERARDLNPL